jgi:hypothetical protein
LLRESGLAGSDRDERTELVAFIPKLDDRAKERLTQDEVERIRL